MSDYINDFVKHPRVDTERPGSASIAEPDDAWQIQLLGGVVWGAVALTPTQVSNIEKWCGVDPRRDEDNVLARAGTQRNVKRYTELHGMRLMAFLAGNNLLEEGEDPVKFLTGVLYDGGYDVKLLEENDE